MTSQYHKVGVAHLDSLYMKDEKKVGAENWMNLRVEVT